MISTASTGILRQIMERISIWRNFIYKKSTESFSDIIAAIQKILFASLEQRLVGFLLDEGGRRKDGKDLYDAGSRLQELLEVPEKQLVEH